MSLVLPALQAPIYATLPVVKMGQMFMYDLYLAQQASQDFQAFTLDDVDAAFDVHRVHSLKFQQSVRLEGECQNASLRCSVASMVLLLPATVALDPQYWSWCLALSLALLLQSLQPCRCIQALMGPQCQCWYSMLYLESPVDMTLLSVTCRQG